jgi:hypothetical protein
VGHRHRPRSIRPAAAPSGLRPPRTPLRPGRYSRLPRETKRRRRSRQRHQAWTSPSVGTSRAGPAPVFDFYWPWSVVRPLFARGTRRARFEGSDRDSCSGRAGVLSGDPQPLVFLLPLWTARANCVLRNLGPGLVGCAVRCNRLRSDRGFHPLTRVGDKPGQPSDTPSGPLRLRLRRDP